MGVYYMGKGINITAIVLRFRDKGEDNNDTIKAHKAIIDTSQHVWWGWWAKDYENAPLDYFKQIEKKIRDKERFVIFLFHTKIRKFYKASCNEIQYNTTDGSSVISSPEPDCTPEYYRSTKVKLWLKFTDIAECDFSILTSSYSFAKDSTQLFANMEDNNSDKKNNLYVSFEGCKVSSEDDFLIQKRTIWFLKKQNKSDEATPVQEWKPLLDNFASHYAKTPHTKILLLSDLHFSLKNSNKHNFPLNTDDPQDYTLIDSIMEIINEKRIEVGGIIIAGDFTFIPCEDDFDLAADFVEELVSRLHIKTSQVAIVPGNHDIAFDKNNADSDKIEFASDESKEMYKNFYRRIYHVEPNEYLCCSKRIILGNGLPIEIICANSSVLQQEEDYFVQGMIGRQQLQLLTNQMDLKRNIKTYTYRIFVMHHHLVVANYLKTPEKKKQYSALLDSGQVQRFLNEYNISLVIHGHEHENIGIALSSHLSQNNRKTEIIGLGSAGSSDLCSNVNNSFGILDFSEYGKVTYESYEIIPNGNVSISPKIQYSFELN